MTSIAGVAAGGLPLRQNSSWLYVGWARRQGLCTITAAVAFVHAAAPSRPVHTTTSGKRAAALCLTTAACPLPCAAAALPAVAFDEGC